MTTKTITQRTCDICQQEIVDGARFVDASPYGRDFHVSCLEKVDGTIIALLVDDVYIQSKYSRDRLIWTRNGIE